MATPKEKPLKIKERPLPTQITLEADAIDQTMAARGLSQRQRSLKAMAMEKEDKMRKEEDLREQKAVQQYRKRRSAKKQAEAASGKIYFDDTPLLSDKYLAEEMQREMKQPTIRQGYYTPKPNIDINKLASQYNEVSNFYAAMGSPNVMPLNDQQVRANPELAASQLQFGLDNPAMEIFQYAVPTGASTTGVGLAKNLFLRNIRSSAPVATRFFKGIGQGSVATGRTIAKNAPKVAGNLFVASVPITAQASASSTQFGGEPNPNALQGTQQNTQQENESEDSGILPWILGGAAVVGGAFGLRKLYKVKPQYFTWWERSPAATFAGEYDKKLVDAYNTAFRTGNQAAMDELKLKVGKSSQKTITQGTGKRAKTIDNPDYISNLELGEMIESKAYPKPTEGFIIERGWPKFWRNARNWGIRFPLYSTAAGIVLDAVSSPSHPTQKEYTAADSTYKETDAAVEAANGAGIDSIRIVPVTDETIQLNQTPSNRGFKWSTSQ